MLNVVFVTFLFPLPQALFCLTKAAHGGAFPFQTPPGGGGRELHFGVGVFSVSTTDANGYTGLLS